MNQENQENQQNKVVGASGHKKTVHHILANSYSFYFFGIILGVFFDLIFPIKIIPRAIILPLGLLFLTLAPVLIFWAQQTSYKLSFKKEKLTTADFGQGPYRFTRNPTQLGLALLCLGFGILVNSVFIILFVFIAYFVSRHTVIKEQEQILEKKYGEEYLRYKQSVRNLF